MRVLIATDLSDAADAALREGAALAAAKDDALAVVHVLPPLHPVSVLDERVTMTVRDRVARAIQRPHELFVEVGAAHGEILKRAEAFRADVLVVGSYGHTAFKHLFGSVAERVVRHAHCPVLVVRASAAKGPVLVATDLSDLSLPAIKAGAEEARRRSASLRVVQALGFLELEMTYLAALGSPTISVGASDEEASVRHLAAAVKRAGVDADCAIVQGPGAAAIVREAIRIEAQLVVVGAVGHTGLARLSLGGVAEKVARAAPCSVLVVRQIGR